MTRKPPAIVGLGQTTTGQWRDDAACIGADVEIFFPHSGVSDMPAKMICAICPVRGECLEDALAAGRTLQGVFGGLNMRERSTIIRHRQRICADDRPERAAAMFRELRPTVASDYAAHLIIAAQFGVHHRTVDKWVIARAQTEGASST